MLTRAGGISDRSLPVNMSLQWHRLGEQKDELAEALSGCLQAVTLLKDSDSHATRLNLGFVNEKMNQLWPKLVGPGGPQEAWAFSRTIRKPPICPTLWFSGKETRMRERRPVPGPTARQWLVQHQGGQVLLSSVSFSHGMGCGDM